MYGGSIIFKQWRSISLSGGINITNSSTKGQIKPRLELLGGGATILLALWILNCCVFNFYQNYTAGLTHTQ